MCRLKFFLFIVFLVVLNSLVGFPFAFSDISMGVNDNRAIYTEDGSEIITSGESFDIVLIQGTVVSGGKVDIYWDFVSAWDDSSGTGYIATATGTSSGTFGYNLTIPSTPAGPHYVWIQNVQSRETVRSDLFTIMPSIVVSRSWAYVGDKIRITGYGFKPDSMIFFEKVNNSNIQIVGNYSKIQSDSLGYFTCTMRLPDFEYGSYDLNIFDEDNNWYNRSFHINAVFTVSPVEGSSGSVVHIEGRGFTPGNIIATGNVLFDDVAAKIVSDGPIVVSEKGEISFIILVPTLNATKYEIEIIDGAISTITAFWITATTIISVSPGYGSPGDEIALEGTYFSHRAGNSISIFLDDLRLHHSIRVNESGEFAGSIVLPALPMGASYNIRVVDEYGLEDTTPVIIEYVAFTLSSYSGATGSSLEVSIIGFSLLDIDDYAVYFDDSVVIARTDIENGPIFTASFYIPHKSLGSYEVRVVTYPDDVLNSTKRFNVTDQSVFTLSPESVTRGGKVSLSGEYYPEAVLTPVWLMSNSSWSEDVSDYFSDAGQPVKTNNNGSVKGVFDIPFSIRKGRYVISSFTFSKEDLLLQFAELEIQVTSDVLNVSARKEVYHLGDTLTFNINTFDRNASLTLYIFDPDDELYWSCTVTPDEWIKRGTRWSFPHFNQVDDTHNNTFALPNDAVTGAWTWVIETTLTLPVESGVFIVDEHIDNLIINKFNNIIDIMYNINASSSDFDNLTSAALINMTSLQQNLDELIDVLYSYNVDELDSALDELLLDLEDDNQTFNRLSTYIPNIDGMLNSTIKNLNSVGNKYSDVESTYKDMSSIYENKFIKTNLERVLIVSIISASLLILSVLRRAGMLIIDIEFID